MTMRRRSRNCTRAESGRTGSGTCFPRSGAGGQREGASLRHHGARRGPGLPGPSAAGPQAGRVRQGDLGPCRPGSFGDPGAAGRAEVPVVPDPVRPGRRRRLRGLRHRPALALCRGAGRADAGTRRRRSGAGRGVPAGRAMSSGRHHGVVAALAPAGVCQLRPRGGTQRLAAGQGVKLPGAASRRSFLRS